MTAWHSDIRSFFPPLDLASCRLGPWCIRCIWDVHCPSLDFNRKPGRRNGEMAKMAQMAPSPRMVLFLLTVVGMQIPT